MRSSWADPSRYLDPGLYALSAWIATSLLIVLVSYFRSWNCLTVYPLFKRKSSWGPSRASERQDFIANAREIVQLGFKKFGTSKPFRVMSDLGEMLILPPTFANDIRNEEGLSFTEFLKELQSVNVPGFEPFHEGSNSPLIIDTVRTKLTQSLASVTAPLSSEASSACRDIFLDSEEWHEVVLKDSILDLVARLSSRVFLGEEFCHIPAWLRITKEYTVDSFLAAYELHSYPKLLRPIVHWFLPSMQKVRAELKEAEAIITPVLNTRRARKEAAIAKGHTIADRTDAIEWLEQVAQEKNIKYRPAVMQLNLALAAIHTTTDLLTQTMYEIMQHPKIIQPLRDEIVSVISEGGWKKTTLYNLRLMDSVIKEAQRLKPILSINMNRIATTNVHLPDGTLIPKGTKLGVSSHGLWDPSQYPNPEHFDGSRYLRLRDQPGNENSWQLVTTRPEHIAFGHGQHACPGRFFAANEIKIALCHLLLKYEWKLAPTASAPRAIAQGISLDSDPKVRVMLKRRRPEIGL